MSFELEEYQRFLIFIRDIILPFESRGFKSHSEFHRQLMWTACQSLTVTAAPRNHLKSTVVARYRALHRLVEPSFPPGSEKDRVDLYILSESAALAEGHLAWIKDNIVRNPYLIKRYGQMKPSEGERQPWNESEIRLINGSYARAAGYTSQFRGYHPTDIIVDDLESLNNMGTPETLAKLKDHFYRVIMGAMDPGTNLHVIGTIISRESLLSELLSKPEFRGKKWRALEENEDGTYRSLWEERWPVTELLKRRQVMGQHKFNAEYQNEPIGLEDAIIHPEWVLQHTDETLSTVRPIARYMAVDPAFTEERWGDWSAITVLDQGEDMRLYERLSWRKKCSGPDLAKTIVHFANHFQVNVPQFRLGIEEVAAQKMVRQSIMELDPRLGASIIPLRPDKDKARRLIDVSRFFESGMVSLKTKGMIDELLAFPMGDRDRVDSLIYTIKLYEMDNPTGVQYRFSELDPLAKLGDNELELYLERSEDGNPHCVVPKKWQTRRREAMVLAAYFNEEEFW